MKAKSVDEYIENAPEGHRAKLRQMRRLMKRLAPKAKESIGYMMPAYDNGRIGWFAAMKGHLGLYIRPPIIEEHGRELEGYETTKLAVRIPWDRPLPAALIRKLVRARIKMNTEARRKGGGG